MAAKSGYKLPRTGRNVEDLLEKIDELRNATSELDGLMSKEDKAKLDEIEKTTIPVEIPTIDAGDDNPTTIATVGSSPIRVKVNRDNTKVDKEEGKQLSTNDFTNAYKAALDRASESEVIGFVCQSQNIKFYKPKEDGSFEARAAYEFDATDLIVSHNHNVVLYNISDSTFYAPIAFGVQGASGTEYWFFRISVSLEVKYILLYHQGNRPITRANIAGGRELATINSPEFVGTPKAPTMSKSDNSARIATTAFVKNVLSDYYAKPATGIPETDLDNSIRAILDDAVLHSDDVIYNADPLCNTAEIVGGIQMYTSGARRKVVPNGYMAELTGGNYTFYILQYYGSQGGHEIGQTILAYGASPVTWFNNTGQDVTIQFASSVSAPTNAKVYKLGYDSAIADIYRKFWDLVNSAPEALDTLKELADALGDDANFAAHITQQIAEKYTKPFGGIPKNDLAWDVRQSLTRADDSVTHNDTMIFDGAADCRMEETVDGVTMYTSGSQYMPVPDGYIVEMTSNSGDAYILETDSMAIPQSILASGSGTATWVNNTGDSVYVKFASGSYYNTSSAKIYKEEFDTTIDRIEAALAGKQDTIADIDDIREGAAAGAAAAPQATTYTKSETDSLLSQKQGTLTFDNTPTAGSTNPVTSAGIKTYVDSHTPTITMDDAPSASSSNPVKSSGIYSALQGKADTTALTSINGAIATNTSNISQLQAAYAALTQNAVVIGALPASGVANTIYRVPDTATYSDYMWDGSQFVLMATYDNAIDDTPQDGSPNLVKSGGVAEYVGLPVVLIDYSASMVRAGANLGTIILRAGHTYKATISRTEVRANVMYVCSGSSSSAVGTIYINLNLSSTAPLSKTVYYTNDTGADITANIIVAGNWSQGYWVNPHLVIEASNNNLVWTSPQDMTGEQMKQAQANIGITKAPIEFYEDKPYFVDGSTWRTGQNGVYACKVIPVTGGGKIVCTGPDPTVTTTQSGIAFLNSFDEAYILANLPCPVDGTANNNIQAGETRTFDIPSTCTYIALRSKYASNSKCMPQSLVIDGTEYMLNTADYLASLVLKESGSTTYERNITKDAAVRATGKKAVTATDILPLSLIHVSDIHTKSDNYKCFKNACEYIGNYDNIAAMIVTGDLVWDSYADPMTYYDEAVQGVTKPVLNVVGNHDAGQYKSALGLSSVSTDVQCYERYIAPYVDGWGVTQPSDAATAGKSYYYKDFADQKVRLIVLCEFETDYELNSAGTGLVYSREYRAMRQAQVTWLIDTLTNTPSDYGVVVAMHQPLGILGAADNAFVSFDLVGGYKYNVYSEDKEWLAKILNAYATKSALTLSVAQTGAVVTTLNCNCDFTGVQSEFICVLCGHTHRDYIGRLANYPSIPILCVGADNLLYTSGFQPRAEGTPSEDLFNVVNIDRNRKTIKVVRIGSDASVTGQVRDQLLISYAQ